MKCVKKMAEKEGVKKQWKTKRKEEQRQKEISKDAGCREGTKMVKNEEMMVK